MSNRCAVQVVALLYYSMSYFPGKTLALGGAVQKTLGPLPVSAS